ncbi:retrovirus-related pol polyprotein from transposon TNT 1-94 [Tanacetum coccineum]
MWNDLILAHEGPSDTRDTKIASLRLKFNAFKSLEGEKVNGTFTRLKCLLNDLENGVSIPQAEVNATFVNSLPRKWLSMNQTQRTNNSIKSDCLATLYGKYNYEEGLIDQIYESETQRFSIHASSSKALISNNHFQDSDSDVEEDQRTSNEFMADLNVEYHERALLANQKRFYKRSRRVGSARKPIDKSKETCFACGKPDHFQKDCPSNKTSTPSYPSSHNSFNKPKPYTASFNQTSSQNTGNHQKVYKGKYNGLKAKMAVLTKRIDDLTTGNSEKGKNKKGKSETGLIAKSFDWDEESVSLEDEGTTKIRAFMAIAEDDPSVGKVDARSGQWVDITMKKVHRLLSMTDGDERKHVLDYTHVDLHYVEDQRKNLLNKFNLLKQELSLHNKVTLDQLLSERVLGNIVKALGGRGRRKEKTSSKDVVFTKANESPPLPALEITSDSESKCDTQESLPPLPKLIGLIPLKKTNKTRTVPKSCSDKKANSSTKQLLLTLMEECSTCGSTNHLTKEHTEQDDVKKTLINLKAQSSVNPSAKKAPMIPKPFKECKYCGFNDHHSNNYEYYPGCEEYLKRSVWYLDSGCSRHMTWVKQYLHKYSKESGPKVVFGDDSSGDTEGYGLVNCNGITFTRVAYVNCLKHNLISINQLCDANFKVLFTKTQGTIFNQNDEVLLIAPRKRDVYIIDIKMENLNEVKVKELRSDNGTEFRNHKLEEFCDEKGISQNFSSLCTPEQNGVAERRNETLIEAARTMLNSAKLPKQFWGEAFNTACYTQNRSIIVKRYGKTSYDVFRGRSPDISYFHVFGCPVHIHNHRDHLGKFDEKADDGFFLGYSLVTKAFRDFVSLKEPPEFTVADDHPTLIELDQPKSADNLEPTEIQDNVIMEPISDVQPSPIISPLAEGILQPPVSQDRWSTEKYIELVNIIGEPLAGIMMRFLALGWHLEDIHVTWAHLEKKQMRLRTYIKSLGRKAYSAWRRRLNLQETASGL